MEDGDQPAGEPLQWADGLHARLYEHLPPMLEEARSTLDLRDISLMGMELLAEMTDRGVPTDHPAYQLVDAITSETMRLTVAFGADPAPQKNC